MKFTPIMIVVLLSKGPMALAADVNCGESQHPFARGACAVVQCPDGQWSRGSAKLISAGRIIASAGLETDRVDLGACGWIQFELQDNQQNTVAYGYTQERCIPAKGRGRARIEFFPPVEQSVPAEIATRVVQVKVSAFCSGGRFTPFGLQVSKEEAKDGIKLVLGKP